MYNNKPREFRVTGLTKYNDIDSNKNQTQFYKLKLVFVGNNTITYTVYTNEIPIAKNKKELLELLLL